MIEITDSLSDDATLTADLATPGEAGDHEDFVVLNVTADGPDGYVAGAGLYLNRESALMLARYLTGTFGD